MEEFLKLIKYIKVVMTKTEKNGQQNNYLMVKTKVEEK